MTQRPRRALARILADNNTPPVARSWGYRMNMGMDVFESMFAKAKATPRILKYCCGCTVLQSGPPPHPFGGLGRCGDTMRTARAPRMGTPTSFSTNWLMVGLALAAAGCLDPGESGNLVPKTVDEDPTLPRIEIADTVLHAEAFGDPGAPIVMVLHGGPGSDYRRRSWASVRARWPDWW